MRRNRRKLALAILSPGGIGGFTVHAAPINSKNVCNIDRCLREGQIDPKVPSFGVLVGGRLALIYRLARDLQSRGKG